MTRTYRKAAVAAAMTVALSLTGCGGGSGGSGNAVAGGVKTSEGDVTLSLNWWGSNTRVQLTEQAIQNFEKDHPNIHVELQYKDWSGYWDQLATLIAGNNAPDVMQMDAQYLASYASQGALYDLSQVGDYLKFDGMTTSLRDMGKFNGIQYAAPISSSQYSVIVNHDVLDKYGLTLPDTSTWTWDEFTDFAKQLWEKSNGEVTGIESIDSELGLSLWARQHGEQLWKDGKIAISEKTLADFLQLTYDWTHNGVSGNANRWIENNNVTGGSDDTDFAKNRQAMKFATATMINSYSKSAGTENMTLEPLPSDTKDAYTYMPAGMYWAISATSEHPAEAAILIDYLLNNEGVGEIFGTERGIPANSAILKKLTAKAEGINKKVLEYAEEYSKTLGEAPSIPPNGASSIRTTMIRYQQDVALGNQSAADAAKAMIAEVQAAIDEAN